MSFKLSQSIFADRSAASIMSEEAGAWVKGLITPERSAATVKKTWLNASKTVFQWALEQKHMSRNPFIGIKVTVPKRKQLRETRALHADEASTILIASVKITETRTAHKKRASGGCHGSVRTLAHAPVK